MMSCYDLSGLTFQLLLTHLAHSVCVWRERERVESTKGLMLHATWNGLYKVYHFHFSLFLILFHICFEFGGFFMSVILHNGEF
jgi:hypothetical protein